jgi:hypothetical protein
MVRGGVSRGQTTGGSLVVRSRTDGAIVLEGRIPAGLAVAWDDLGPGREKRFEVLYGQLGFEFDRQTHVAAPGSRVSVPAAADLALWNPGDLEAHFVCELRETTTQEERAPSAPPARRRLSLVLAVVGALLLLALAFTAHRPPAAGGTPPQARTSILPL